MLTAIKLLHTAIWAFLAASILVLPVAGVLRRFRWAAILTVIVLLECGVLAVNRGRCPLTDVAARYTVDRGSNFDIYLPNWLAQHNKVIFGLLFVAGELVVVGYWFRDRFRVRLEGTMSPRTVFLSRLIGLYCIVVALSMITRKQAIVETVTTLLQNPSMMLILGVITLAAGLAMVLAHNVWSGGALAVVVSLVGWITLIKSLLLLFLPREMEARLYLEQLHYQQLFYFYAAFSLVLGIYLTYGGFRSTSS